MRFCAGKDVFRLFKNIIQSGPKLPPDISIMESALKNKDYLYIFSPNNKGDTYNLLKGLIKSFLQYLQNDSGFCVYILNLVLRLLDTT